MIRAELGDDFVDAARPKGESKKKEKSGKGKSKRPSEEDAVKKAELELLTLDTGDSSSAGIAAGAKHFNMRDIMKAQRVEGKKIKAKDRERLADAAKDDFKINLKDERFSALYDSHLFALDPSAPQFKKTKAMQSVVEERQRRQKSSGAQEDVPVSTGDNEPRDRSLASLVANVKRKATANARPAPQGVGKRQRM